MDFTQQYVSNKHNLPCPKCDGNESVSIFNEPKPHLHCFKCEQQEWDEEIVEEWKTMSQTNVSNIYTTPVKKKASNFPQRGIISSIEGRGITQETAEKFKVEKLYNEDKKAFGYAYPYEDAESGDLVAQKIKRLDKKMVFIGEPSKGALFGQKSFPKGGRFLTITEGEEDAMAVYQMTKDHAKHNKSLIPAVVSIKNGVGSAVKDCRNSYEYIDSFDEIIICFDGDPVGQEAAQKVAKLFPHKTKIVNFIDARQEEIKDSEGNVTKKWKLKDANDYLKEGKNTEFISLWWKAEKYVPNGVRTFRSLWDDMTRKDSNITVPFPWDGVNQMCYGMVTGKMDVFKANPKIGKTTFLSECVMHIRDNSEHNVGVIFLENTTKEIGLKLCGIRVGEPLDRPEYQDKIDWEELQKVHEDISEDDRITIFDPSDERTAENVLKKIMYFVKAHECKFIFLDHASMLSYTADSTDERKFLDKLFADLKQLTTSLDIYLGVVIHVNDDGKPRGSRAPVQLCDRLYSLQRDKLSTDPIVANTTEFIVEENRWGSSGLASKLFYDNDTGRIMELDIDLEDNRVKERTVKFED